MPARDYPKACSLIYLLWAKTNPFKSLPAHMIDAGCCAKAYLESPAASAILGFLKSQWNCTGEEAVSFTAYLVAMHDIGKASPQFQMENEDELIRLMGTELREAFPEKEIGFTRHEFLSGKIAGRIWKKGNADRRVRDPYATVLSLHHQRLDTSDSKKPKVHEYWELMQDETERIIRETFGFSGYLPVPQSYDSVCILLTGLVIICDWVSSSGFFDVLDIGSPDYFRQSLCTAKSAMLRCGLLEDHRISGIDSFQSLWPEITTPRDIQHRCEELKSGAPLTIIEAPMGEGKTEAALYRAVRELQNSDKRGIYIALPTQATSNQMYGRFVRMIDQASGGHTRLLHGTAFLMKDEWGVIHSNDADEAEKWLGTSRMGLLDENGVGTVDQAMGAVLRARFSVLRLLGLANKVLIIDELHAYDAYMSEIIESLLRWCRALSVPVILLSATLQDSQRKRYLKCYTDGELPPLNDGYPLITQVMEDMSIIQTEAEATLQSEYTFKTDRLGRDEEKAARLALDTIRNGGCCCVLANTVKRAQAVYRKLQELKDQNTETMLFHARFTLGKREEIEGQCLRKFGKSEQANRPEKAVLVATQVVEQSLDIDFDTMITELAPIDLLLQRAGRVHRHRSRVRPAGLENPIIHVILPDPDTDADLETRYDSSGFVYAPFLLYNTEKLLESKETIRVPADVRSIINQVYESVTEDNLTAWQKRAFSQQLMAASADNAAFPPPASETFFPAQSHPEFENIEIDDGFDPSSRASTRLGDPTFRIAFTDRKHLKIIQGTYMTPEQQKEILLSSVSLRLTPQIRDGLQSGEICRIRKGALSGCYAVDGESSVIIGSQKLINDPEIGIYWEGQ